MKKLTNTLLALTLAAPGLALAADDEITMQVIEGETPEAVTQEIALPETAGEQAMTNSGTRMETATQTRTRTREMAGENMEAARERHQEMQEQQQQIREQREDTMQQIREEQADTSGYRSGQ